MEKTKHTPKQLRYEKSTQTIRSVPDNFLVASIDLAATAELMVRAYNSHADLLAACEDGIKFLQCLPATECELQQDNRRACYKIFTAAIEKAKTV